MLQHAYGDQMATSGTHFSLSCEPQDQTQVIGLCGKHSEVLNIGCQYDRIQPHLGVQILACLW